MDLVFVIGRKADSPWVLTLFSLLMSRESFLHLLALKQKFPSILICPVPFPVILLSMFLTLVANRQLINWGKRCLSSLAIVNVSYAGISVDFPPNMQLCAATA